MRRALIHPEICTACRPCPVETECPNHAVLREQDADKPWIDFYHCSGCLKCKTLCPQGAIEEITQPCNGKGRMGW